MGAGQHGIFHAAEDLGHDITENELPDITKDDTADQVGQEIGCTEEPHALELGCTQKSQQESHQIDQDHVEDDEKGRQQDGPEEAGLAEHPCIVGKAYELCITDAVPVGKGIEKSQEQGDDDCDRKCKKKREQENHIDQRSVVFQSGKQIHSRYDTDDADHKKRSAIACFGAHKVKGQGPDQQDDAADQADQGEQLRAGRSFFHNNILQS